MQKKYLLAFALTALTAFNYSPTALSEGKYTGKIIDGTLVPSTQFPATTLVLLPDSLCTGTLIADKYVLTAAHCFFDEQNHLQSNVSGVAAVVNNVSYPAAKVTIHPDYVSRASACIPGETDAAVLELKNAVSGVAPIELYRSAPTVGDNLLLVGFGTQGKGATGQDDTLPPDGFVNFAYTKVETIDNGQFVSWISRKGYGNTASGDSGGPAFIDVSGVRYLHSITCGGTGNAEYGSESTNTRVDSMASWIDSVAHTSAPNTPPSFFGLGTVSGSTNQAFSYSIQVSGASPISVTAENLPPGLTLAGTTISGVPTTAGSFDVALQASNGLGTATGTLTLVIAAFDPNSAFVISSAKIDFRDNDNDTIDLKGTIVLPANFAPKGSVVRISVAGVSQTFKLSRNGLGERRRGYDFVKLNGKLSKGKYVNPTVRFTIGLVDSQVLYDALYAYFPEDTADSDPNFYVTVPVEFEAGGTTLSQTINVKFKAQDRWTLR